LKSLTSRNQTIKQCINNKILECSIKAPRYTMKRWTCEARKLIQCNFSLEEGSKENGRFGLFGTFSKEVVNKLKVTLKMYFLLGV